MQSTIKRYGFLIVLALFGGILGFTSVQFTTDASGDWRWPTVSEPTMVLAAALLAMAAMSVLMSASDAMIRRAFAIDRSENDLSRERRILRLQSISLAVAGTGLAILGLGAEATGAAPELLFAASIALIAGQTLLNRVIRRDCDEFMRQLSTEIGSMTFWVFQFLLFAWAAAARFGLTASPEPLLVYDLLMAAYLGASLIVQLRRGVGVPS